MSRVAILGLVALLASAQAVRAEPRPSALVLAANASLARLGIPRDHAGPVDVTAVLARMGIGSFSSLHLGMRAQEIQDPSVASCPLTACAGQQTTATVPGLFDVVRGASTAAAVVVYLTDPRDKTVITPSIRGGGVSLSLAGKF